MTEISVFTARYLLRSLGSFFSILLLMLSTRTARGQTATQYPPMYDSFTPKIVMDQIKTNGLDKLSQETLPIIFHVKLENTIMDLQAQRFLGRSISLVLCPDRYPESFGNFGRDDIQLLNDFTVLMEFWGDLDIGFDQSRTAHIYYLLVPIENALGSGQGERTSIQSMSQTEVRRILADRNELIGYLLLSLSYKRMRNGDYDEAAKNLSAGAVKLRTAFRQNEKSSTSNQQWLDEYETSMRCKIIHLARSDLNYKGNLMTLPESVVMNGCHGK